MNTLHLMPLLRLPAIIGILLIISSCGEMPSPSGIGPGIEQEPDAEDTPETMVIMHPPDNYVLGESDSTIILVWQSVPGALLYELEIALSPFFNNRVVSNSIMDTTVEIAGLAAGNYYWHVRSMDSTEHTGPWSEVRQFYIRLDTAPVLEFSEYEHNPVITGSADWNYRAVVGPCVLYEDGLYSMWFSGYGTGQHHIGYASSSDGIIWNVESDPVLSPDTFAGRDEVSLRWPYVLSEEGGYRMWYTAMNSEGEWQIFLATSSDKLTWSRYSNEPVLGISDSYDFGAGHVLAPCIRSVDGIYYMWYGAHTLEGPAGVGLAFSYNGIDWEPYEGNPVFARSDETGYESYAAGIPWVLVKPNGTYELFYSGNIGGAGAIGRAFSEDGLTWTRDLYNPIITPGPAGSWNDNWSAGASVLLQDDEYKFWYAGHDGGTWYIGFGTARQQK